MLVLLSNETDGNFRGTSADSRGDSVVLKKSIKPKAAASQQQPHSSRTVGCYIDGRAASASDSRFMNVSAAATSQLLSHFQSDKSLLNL